MGANVVDLGGGCRIEFDWKAFNQVRKSGGIRSAVRQAGDAMAARAGADNFECSVFDKPTRCIAIVTNSTREGAVMEATEKSLTKAVR